MRCKRHPYEGGVGVCATCLRERLLALVAAQEREAADESSPEERRRSDNAHPPPPPLVFPRSVSPYVSRRSAAGRERDAAWWQQHNHNHHHQPRFYSTPQVGPSFRGSKNGRFSLISAIFRSRSDDRDADPRVSDASSKTSSSPSWISYLLPGRRKKKSRLFSLDEEGSSTGGCRRTRRTRNRGMSPVSKGRDEGGSESPAGSGYSSESPIGYRKQTPGPPRRRATPPHVSGFAFCLSPLVRASPNAASRVDAGFSGEIRSANRFHLSTAASLGANRSRKLADFGRYP